MMYRLGDMAFDFFYTLTRIVENDDAWFGSARNQFAFLFNCLSLMALDITQYDLRRKGPFTPTRLVQVKWRPWKPNRK